MVASWCLARVTICTSSLASALVLGSVRCAILLLLLIIIIILLLLLFFFFLLLLVLLLSSCFSPSSLRPRR